MSSYYSSSVELLHNFYQNAIILGLALALIGALFFKTFGYLGPFIGMALLSVPSIFIKFCAPLKRMLLLPQSSKKFPTSEYFQTPEHSLLT